MAFIKSIVVELVLHEACIRVKRKLLPLGDERPNPGLGGRWIDWRHWWEERSWPSKSRSLANNVEVEEGVGGRLLGYHTS